MEIVFISTDAWYWPGNKTNCGTLKVSPRMLSRCSLSWFEVSADEDNERFNKDMWIYVRSRYRRGTWE